MLKVSGSRIEEQEKDQAEKEDLNLQQQQPFEEVVREVKLSSFTVDP
jgi:hypothetical protein